MFIHFFVCFEDLWIGEHEARGNQVQYQTELDNLHRNQRNRSSESLRFLIELQDQNLGHKEAEDVEECANQIENRHSA